MAPQPELETEVVDQSEVWVEKASNMLYEVKFFDTYVLARPASHDLYNLIRKIDHITFATEFEEFYGNREEVSSFMQGQGGIYIMGERR